MYKDRNPKVSVIMPCLNEEAYISTCLDSLIANDYDHDEMEILVVDGMSYDRTREILTSYCERYDFIKILDNPKQITPAALNIGIKSAKGETIVRVDAHAIYATNYLTTLVKGLDRYAADNIGGVRQTALVEENPLTLAISLAISHPFTAGNAYYRTGSDKVREVDTVFCGCFRRDLFCQIGYFNENIVRTEDRDFNARILANGGKIVLDPSTTCTYYPRTDIWKYLKWSAYGPYRLFYNHRFTDVNMVSWRNFAPAILLLWHLIALLALLISPIWGLVVGLPILLYWMVVTILSVQLAIQFRLAALCPTTYLVFVLTHYAYGIGSLFGMPWWFLERVKGQSYDKA